MIYSLLVIFAYTARYIYFGSYSRAILEKDLCDYKLHTDKLLSRRFDSPIHKWRPEKGTLFNSQLRNGDPSDNIMV